ncbi:MAG: hypothetical protein C5B51_11790 [Terriglobia bacterium]|nr:MAG: hypothetical protein C5B51_11790 [Terriglobia bacterium]
MTPTGPIIAIVGNVTTHADAGKAAEALGRELAKGGFRILIYSSKPEFLEVPVLRGYAATRVAARCSVQVRYPLHSQKPEFPEQQTNSEIFDWRPDNSPDWESSFYRSLSDVDGVLLLGGGESTLIAGLVAMGHGIAIMALAGFQGKAFNVWQALRPGHDLVTSDEVSLMARPDWSDDLAAECIKTLKDQIARKAEIARKRRVEEIRRETSVSRQATAALLLFIAAVVSVPVAWGWTTIPQVTAIWLLFMSPLLAGVAGSTIRLVFDLRQDSAPLTPQSAVTTAALGLIAGGIAGLLFITAQVTTSPVLKVGDIVSQEQARKLVPFGVLIGFVAGLTLDAVFRKLIATDVVDTGAIEVKKRP